MTLLLILFIASGFVMIYLVLHKHMEIVYGRGLILKTLIHKADRTAHAHSGILGRYVSLITRRNIVFALNYTLVLFLRACIMVGSFVRKKMTEMVDRLSQKQETLTRNGAASAYLKQISESKQNNYKTGTSTKDSFLP